MKLEVLLSTIDVKTKDLDNMNITCKCTVINKGIKEASSKAVLNANYMMNKLKDYYDVAYDNICMHEFVLSGERQKEESLAWQLRQCRT